MCTTQYLRIHQQNHPLLRISIDINQTSTKYAKALHSKYIKCITSQWTSLLFFGLRFKKGIHVTFQHVIPPQSHLGESEMSLWSSSKNMLICIKKPLRNVLLWVNSDIVLLIGSYDTWKKMYCNYFWQMSQLWYDSQLLEIITHTSQFSFSLKQNCKTCDDVTFVCVCTEETLSNICRIRFADLNLFSTTVNILSHSLPLSKNAVSSNWISYLAIFWLILNCQRLHIQSFNLYFNLGKQVETSFAIKLSINVHRTLQTLRNTSLGRPSARLVERPSRVQKALPSLRPFAACHSHSLSSCFLSSLKLSYQ